MAIETPAPPQIERKPSSRAVVERIARDQRRAKPSRPVECDRRLDRPHVMSEEIFRTVLIRERKRADRFNQPFLLFLVGVDGSDAALLPPAVVDALGAVTRDTDVLGWFEEGAALGLIVPEVGAAGVELARHVEGRIRKELALRLDPKTRRQVSLRLHAHLPAADAADAGLASVDPIVASLRREKQSQWRDSLKRALDVGGSATLLLILSPLFLLDRRARQADVAGPGVLPAGAGRRAWKPFTMLKFRTHAREQRQRDPSGVRDASSSSRAASADEPEGKHVSSRSTNDPRITPIGRLAAQDQPRRAAAVLERAARRHVAGRARGRRSRTRSSSTALALPPGARSQARHHRPVAGDRAQPDDVRRDGAPRPSLRQDAARSGPTSRFCSRRPGR